MHSLRVAILCLVAACVVIAVNAWKEYRSFRSASRLTKAAWAEAHQALQGIEDRQEIIPPVLHTFDYPQGESGRTYSFGCATHKMWTADMVVATMKSAFQDNLPRCTRALKETSPRGRWIAHLIILFGHGGWVCDVPRPSNPVTLHPLSQANYDTEKRTFASAVIVEAPQDKLKTVGNCMTAIVGVRPWNTTYIRHDIMGARAANPLIMRCLIAMEAALQSESATDPVTILRKVLEGPLDDEPSNGYIMMIPRAYATLFVGSS